MEGKVLSCGLTTAKRGGETKTKASKLVIKQVLETRIIPPKHIHVGANFYYDDACFLSKYIIKVYLLIAISIGHSPKVCK